ncbi:MAG: thioesterase family protein [Solirubrobacterales bacterium]|nr:thioesterase family protein [Solirubrobacterales bacterium]MBV9806610.1 thioesterase family protein [Solirubrobacterales bacterium]
MSVTPVFEGSDGRFVATDFGRGPWDPRALHGGAPAALLVRAFERLPGPEGLGLARVTYEFLRPVPVGPLEVRADVVRPGRRVQLLEGSVLADGVEVVRARGLRVQTADAGGAGGAGGEEAQPPPGPEHGQPAKIRVPHRPMFAFDAIEIVFVAGQWGGGPSTAWFRLRSPIVAGETPSALQRLAAAGDFGNGISATLSWYEYLYINPDLTLYVEREPVGEWICLESRTRISPGGIGLAESVLYDTRGRVGHATQALLVAPR